MKPLGRKAYGSIPHLPGSRLGKGEHAVSEGQARICTVKTRDEHDTVIVQEKLDGSCTAVAKINGVIHPLGRAGWLAVSSPYEQHRMFASWVWRHEDRFRAVLRDGERLVGEWLAQAHGTKYDLRCDKGDEPWGVFDLMRGGERALYQELRDRVEGRFHLPNKLHEGGAKPVAEAMVLHQTVRWPSDEPEGVVYRVERKGKVDFLAKWVRPGKVDGKYLPEISGGEPVWNWRPEW
jgi:ATP-dependent RNA circularization protein (DNA/RNA ligase family)